MGEKKNPFGVDLWAVSDALEITTKMTRNGNPTTVTIFTDLHAAINKKADVATKDVARRGRKITDHWSLLMHIKKKVEKTKVSELVQWHQTKSQESETTVQGFYILKIKSRMSPTLGKTSERYATRCNAIFSAQGWTRSNWDLLGQDKSS